jgi:hypothetical protein
VSLSNIIVVIFLTNNKLFCSQMQSSLCWCKKNVCLEDCWGRGDNRIGVAMIGSIYHERQVRIMLVKIDSGVFPLTIFAEHLV